MQASVARVSMPAKILAVFMALVVAIAFIPAPAYAATKTVKKQAFTTNTTTVKKKSVTVKRGKTVLTFKAGQGFLKFKAPKTKTYKFTFSDLSSPKYASNAYVSVYRMGRYGLEATKVSTQGGKNTRLWLAMNGYKQKAKAMKNRRLKTRTAKIKLTKGQTLYFYFYSGDADTTATLKIK